MNSKSCNSIAELLVEYCDGELPADQTQRVAAHLVVCPHCQAELRLLERSLDLARAVWRQSASQISAGGPLPVRSGRRWLQPAACLAACVALLLATAAVWLAWHGRPRGDASPDRVAQMQRLDIPEPAEDIDIEAFIARQGRAARLAASAQVLATQPGLREYTEQAERYLAENYGDTPAGQWAARQLATPN